MYNCDKMGVLNLFNFVVKILYVSCMDGISNMFFIIALSFGKTDGIRVLNLIVLLDGYFLYGV